MSGTSPRSGLKHFFTLAKLSATVALFWYVFSRIDIAELVAQLTVAQIAAALAAGVGIVSIQALAVAQRLRYCARLLGHDVIFSAAWVACQYGGFFSHTPISFIGGDAMRVWHMVKQDMPLSDSTKAVLMDRAIGFIATMILVIATAPLLYPVIHDATMRTGYATLVAGGTAAVAAFAFLGRVRPISTQSRWLHWLAEFATLARYFAGSPRVVVKAFGAAIVVALLSVLAIWGIALGYSGVADLRTTVAATPVVLLIAMVPISVAGWGLREGAFVVAFGLFGAPASAALTVSVTYGIAVFLAYSPAAIVLLLARRRLPSEVKQDGGVPAPSQPRESAKP